MTIVAAPACKLTPREELYADIGMLVSEAASSEDAIDSWSLSSDILDAVESRIFEVWGTVENSFEVRNVLRNFAALRDRGDCDVPATGILMVKTVRKAMTSAWVTS